MNYVCLVYGEENYIAALSKEGLAELDRARAFIAACIWIMWV